MDRLRLFTSVTHMPGSTDSLIAELTTIVGKAHVLTKGLALQRYTKGFRYGGGRVLAVVRPGTLVEQWRTLKACVDAQAIVIFQSANTGLTGGSTPLGDYDRPVILINTLRIDAIHLIDDGRQVICLAGATLYGLERVLKPLGREPHSVIGSSCIGASVVGGICNNSGGALVQRGPAYTELALFARIDSDGALILVNHLGVRLGADPEEILERCGNGLFSNADIDLPVERAGSSDQYEARVRDIDAPSPARFNADPSHLFEVSGCAGKLAVFAVRLNTFPAEKDAVTFYIGTNAIAELTQLRRSMLSSNGPLPIAGEYMHRQAYGLAEEYGKDNFLAIRWLGTDLLPRFFAVKAAIDMAVDRIGLGQGLSDRLLQTVSRLFPTHLPHRMQAFRDRYEHHLILKVSAVGAAEARSHLGVQFPSTDGDFFECTGDEGAKAFLHRFVAAGTAIRYRNVHQNEVQDILALDVALRRNDDQWFEELPAEIEGAVLRKLYYGHFFCHVFHQDYILKKGIDPAHIKENILQILDSRGAEYPAEHNVGHSYVAKPDLAHFYQELDPCNRFNPGIGHTSRREGWK